MGRRVQWYPLLLGGALLAKHALRGFCVVSEGTLVNTANVSGIVMWNSERFIHFLCWLFVESWQ